MADGLEGLLGMRVMTTSMLPGDMVIMVRNGEVMYRFIWTANALADQEREIERLKAEAALAREEGRRDVARLLDAAAEAQTNPARAQAMRDAAAAVRALASPPPPGAGDTKGNEGKERT